MQPTFDPRKMQMYQDLMGTSDQTESIPAPDLTPKMNLQDLVAKMRLPASQPAPAPSVLAADPSIQKYVRQGIDMREANREPSPDRLNWLAQQEANQTPGIPLINRGTQEINPMKIQALRGLNQDLTGMQSNPEIQQMRPIDPAHLNTVNDYLAKKKASSLMDRSQEPLKVNLPGSSVDKKVNDTFNQKFEKQVDKTAPKEMRVSDEVNREVSANYDKSKGGEYSQIPENVYSSIQAGLKQKYGERFPNGLTPEERSKEEMKIKKFLDEMQFNLQGNQ